MGKKGIKQKEKAENKNSPRVAPGMTEEPIEEEASSQEIARGEFTRVVKLDMDRNVP